VRVVERRVGGRRSVRYGLTRAGRETLLEWLRSPNAVYELRDEALLKLFFADPAEPRESIALIRSFREQRQARLDRLRQISADAGNRSQPTATDLACFRGSGVPSICR